MSLLAELREYSRSHRDVTTPVWNGYLLTVSCSCGVVLSDGSRLKTRMLICGVSHH